MHTARLLTLSQYGTVARGVCLPEGLYLPVGGGYQPRGVPAWGGTCPGNPTPRGQADTC